MKLHLLGVNGPYPESGGATSGYLLETENALIQFDFGTGILSRLTSLCPPESLDAIFISHWHFDHTSDLLPLLYRLADQSCSLTIYGPADDTSVLRQIIAASSSLKLETVQAGNHIPVGSALVSVGEARHPVPGVSYRLSEGGKDFGYTGDTNTLPSLADFFRGCDLLLADGLFPKEAWAEDKPHLSAALAARLAREAGVGKLIITHLNPSFPPETLLSEAREVFPAVALASAGQIISL